VVDDARFFPAHDRIISPFLGLVSVAFSAPGLDPPCPSTQRMDEESSRRSGRVLLAFITSGSSDGAVGASRRSPASCGGCAGNSCFSVVFVAAHADRVDADLLPCGFTFWWMPPHLAPRPRLRFPVRFPLVPQPGIASWEVSFSSRSRGTKEVRKVVPPASTRGGKNIPRIGPYPRTCRKAQISSERSPGSRLGSTMFPCPVSRRGRHRPRGTTRTPRNAPRPRAYRVEPDGVTADAIFRVWALRQRRCCRAATSCSDRPEAGKDVVFRRRFFVRYRWSSGRRS